MLIFITFDIISNQDIFKTRFYIANHNKGPLKVFWRYFFKYMKIIFEN